MPSPNPSPYRDASATHRGFISINDQEFSGVKSFLSPLKMAVYPQEGLPTGIEYPEGMLALKGSFLYNSTINRMMVNTGAQWLQVVLAAGMDDPASLEEHLIDTTNAHMASAIGNDSGGWDWADGTSFNPSTVAAGFLDIGNALGGTNGAAKVGAQPALKADAVWTDISSSVNTSDGWTVLSDPIKALVLGDRILLKGTVRRTTADNTRDLFLTLPTEFVAGRYQPKPIACIAHSPFAYQVLLVGGGYTGTPGLSLLNEPAPGYADLDVILDGFEIYRY